MARLPIGRGAGSRGENSRSTNPRQMNLDELTRRATYIVDDAGQKKAIVVEWSAWQDFVRQAGAEAATAGDGTAAPPANTPAAPRGDVADPGYALQQDRAKVDLYRPKPASRKEAADFTLESNVTRRTND